MHDIKNRYSEGIVTPEDLEFLRKFCEECSQLSNEVASPSTHTFPNEVEEIRPPSLEGLFDLTQTQTDKKRKVEDLTNMISTRKATKEFGFTSQELQNLAQKNIIKGKQVKHESDKGRTTTSRYYNWKDLNNLTQLNNNYVNPD